MITKNQYGNYLLKTTLAEDQYYRDAYAANVGAEQAAASYAIDDERRAAVRADFPFTQVVKGSWPEFDYATQWCWSKFGPYQCDPCDQQHSEYPSCPLVLATETLRPTVSKGKDGVETPTTHVEYHDPGTHSHGGVWTHNWLGKTDYDYGYTEFCFKDEAHRDQFAAVCESLGLGPLYAPA